MERLGNFGGSTIIAASLFRSRQTPPKNDQSPVRLSRSFGDGLERLPFYSTKNDRGLGFQFDYWAAHVVDEAARGVHLGDAPAAEICLGWSPVTLRGRRWLAPKRAPAHDCGWDL